MIRTNAVGIQPLNVKHEINRKVPINEIRMADNLFILNAAEWHLQELQTVTTMRMRGVQTRSLTVAALIHNAFGLTASIEHCSDYYGTTMFNLLSKIRILLNFRGRNLDRNPDSCSDGSFEQFASKTRFKNRFSDLFTICVIPDIMALHALMFYRHCFIKLLIMVFMCQFAAAIVQLIKQVLLNPNIILTFILLSLC